MSYDNYDIDGQWLFGFSRSVVIIMIVTDSSFLGKVYDQVSRDNYDSDGQ